MTTMTPLLPKPTFKSLLHGPCTLKQAKPISFLQFPASKSDFSGSKNKLALSKTMTESVRISVCRDSCGSSSEERTGCFGQGAVIDGRNKFQSVFLAGGLEATLNSLLCVIFCSFVASSRRF